DRPHGALAPRELPGLLRAGPDRAAPGVGEVVPGTGGPGVLAGADEVRGALPPAGVLRRPLDAADHGGADPGRPHRPPVRAVSRRRPAGGGRRASGLRGRRGAAAGAARLPADGPEGWPNVAGTLRVPGPARGACGRLSMSRRRERITRRRTSQRARAWARR